MSEQTTILTVTIAHDYICPWCWVGLFQARRLKAEFPQLTLDWVGYELIPEDRFPLPEFKGPKPLDPDRPLNRFQLFAQSENVPFNSQRTIGAVRSHSALEGAEHAKEQGEDIFDAYNEGVYRAYWEKMQDISDLALLQQIAESAGMDGNAFAAAVTERRYNHTIVPFDDEAYAADITHVPTFKFRGERCAEAPYAVIRDLAMRYLIWYDKKA